MKAQLSTPAGLCFAAGTALLYVGTVWLNREALDIDALHAGVSLFYLPAGVKFIALLIGRLWGLLGLLPAHFSMALDTWDQEPLLTVAAYSVLWNLVTFGLILLHLRVLKIVSDLSNLRFRDLIVMSIGVAVLHGLIMNGVAVALDARELQDYWSAAWGMALGDFLGIGSFIMVFAAIIAAFNWRPGRPGKP